MMFKMSLKMSLNGSSEELGNNEGWLAQTQIVPPENFNIDGNFVSCHEMTFSFVGIMSYKLENEKFLLTL